MSLGCYFWELILIKGINILPIQRFHLLFIFNPFNSNSIRYSAAQVPQRYGLGDGHQQASIEEVPQPQEVSPVCDAGDL